ncbi:aldo/keto reductase, partial [Patescibacteria group bacterium]|nr:aldo/keto reductase [Patescibacteria group bacterium]
DTRFASNDHRSHSLTPEWIEKTVAEIERLRFLTEGKKKTLAQAALQFVLSHPAVSAVIPGAKNTTQVLDNAGASDGVLLSEEELKHIREVIPSEGVTRLA